MILSESKIREYRKSGQIVLDPFDEKKLNPNSYNLTLGNRFLTYPSIPSALDLRHPQQMEEFELDNDGFVVDCGDQFVTEPGRLYLAETREYTESHSVVPMIEGRSSVGRSGVFVHVSAGFGDISFCGKWTLEIVTLYPTIIVPGMELCQIFYHEVSGGSMITYTGRYQNSEGVKPSKGI